MGRSRGRPIGIRTEWQTVLDEWLSLIELDAGQQLDLSIVDAATQVLEALHTGRRGLRGALRGLGNTLGELGWPLEQLNSWLHGLSNLTKRSHRTELRSFECQAAFAEGWAERYVRGGHSGVCVDAVTGLATPTFLRLRLKEIYQHCRAFAVVPTEAYCFVIIDANTDDLAPFERDAVMVTTAGVVGEIFHQGETIVRHRSRVIVLASKSESTRHRAEALGQALRNAPITRAADPQVWDGELPASTIELDRRLRDLVG
ncbi:MAG: hypothetical protein QOE09_3359 [Ilumatobacteraceae bacterium]|jgi:hypothetical protein